MSEITDIKNQLIVKHSSEENWAYLKRQMSGPAHPGFLCISQYTIWKKGLHNCHKIIAFNTSRENQKNIS